jgi:hypothetical protein
VQGAGEDEQAFRACLDAHGVLRPGAIAAPDAERSYVVFAQRDDAILDVAALKMHAARFFDAKVGLTTDKHYATAPRVDAARIVLSTPALSGTRLVYARPKAESDLTLEETGSGLVLLARRCATVWLVVPNAAPDPVALAIATVLASHFLGPILAGGELMGVKTARRKWVAS